MKRAPLTSAWKTFLPVGVAALVLATLSVAPPRAATEEIVSSGEPGVVDQNAGGGETTTRTVRRSGGGTTSGGGSSGPTYQCAPGVNGGATDVGVTADSIKLGATVVDSGIGASFLGDARIGMQAVVNRVNRSGGICGRRLDLELVDDGWDFARGGEFLRNLIEDKKVFALAVVPSSEGLKNLSDGGYLARSGVPVVGTDGMLIHQYQDKNIWPVAASTISAMHVMAKEAYDAGARSFGIVYEHTYHFGIEGAFAFNAAVKRLTGKDVVGYSDPLSSPKCDRRFCGISAGQAGYGTEIQTFNSGCFAEPRCDFVALLLEPATALTWMAGGAIAPGDGFAMAGPQPLFTRDFAEECGSACHGLKLWTGYQPPIGGNLGRAPVKRYIEDIRITSASADHTNMFVVGAYLGMSLLVEALQDLGPDVTREGLADVLNTMTFAPGMTAPLRWGKSRFANQTLQAYSIQFKDRFAGWRDERISMRDPWVGKDIP